MFWLGSQYLFRKSYLALPNAMHMACSRWISVQYYPIWAIVLKKCFYFVGVHLSLEQFLLCFHKVTTIVRPHCPNFSPSENFFLFKACIKESVSILLQTSGCTALLAREVKMIPCLSLIRKGWNMCKPQ